MPDTDVAQRPAALPVLNLVTANGRYSQTTKAGFTRAMVAAALADTPDAAGDPVEYAERVLTHMVCGGLLSMRCGPHPTTAPKYEWAYIPTARCWRMIAALAGQGGPTEEELRSDLSDVLVYGVRDPRVRRW